MISSVLRSMVENMKKLMNTKANIKHAIELKNVPIKDSLPFKDYADAIYAIEEGDIFSDNYKIYKAMMNDSFRNASYLFSGKSLTNIDLSSWDTRYITNMTGLFENCSKLETVNVSSLNIDRVTNMNSMFEGCSSLKELDLLSWDISNVKNMNQMFRNCSLKELDLSTWDTSNVTSMSGMFWGCTSLEVLDLSNFTVTESSSGDSPNVRTGSILSGCTALHSLRLDNCSRETIIAILDYDYYDEVVIFGQSNFPTNRIYAYDENGEVIEIPRVIYCKKENMYGIELPECWTFYFV